MDQRENFGRPWQRLSRGRPTVLLTSFQPPPPWEMYTTYPVPASSRAPASSAVRVVHDVLKTVIYLKLTIDLNDGSLPFHRRTNG